MLCQQGGEQFEQLKQKLQRGLAQAVKKLTAKIAAFQQQLDDSEKAEASRKQADMLMANLYRCVSSLDVHQVSILPRRHSLYPAESQHPIMRRVDAGATSVEVEDWDSGKEIKIALDPTKSCVEQAEALYKKARKQGHAADKLLPLLEAAQEQVQDCSSASCMRLSCVWSTACWCADDISGQRRSRTGPT